jgi:hypothetical protein
MPPAKREPKDFGPHQLADRIGVPHGLVDQARDLGVFPRPDTASGRWSAELAGDIAGRWPEIAAAADDRRALGAARCAGILSGLTGLDIDADDVWELADRGLLAASREYQGIPLYRVRDVEALAGEAAKVTVLAAIAGERQAWLDASLDAHAAAEQAGWKLGEFTRAAASRGVSPGRYRRYARADVDALAADEDLDDEVRGLRLIGAAKAAGLLELRHTDWQYCVAAGWIRAAGDYDMKVESGRWVSVPLYRMRDVEAIRDLPGIDWEAVRGVRPGRPSLLREYASLPVPRGALVRGLAADLSAEHHVEVTAAYDSRRDRWELAWVPNSMGYPETLQVRERIWKDRDLRPYFRDIMTRVIRPGRESEAR